MNKKGFTLVELLTVIAILAVIVAFAVPNVLKIFNKSVEEVMKIEEHNVVDASMLYISDNCGRNALSEEKREACNALIDNNRVGTNEVYFCLSTIQNDKYIDGISYRGSSPCNGLVVYKYDDDLGKFTDGRAFLQCGENEYLTKGYESYKEKIEGCTGESVSGQGSTPPPNPNPNPSQCTEGYYEDNGSCTKCPNGYTSDVGANNINECYIMVPAGKKIDSITGNVVDCETGKYRENEAKVFYGNSLECNSCSTNYFSLSKTSNQCIKCNSWRLTNNSTPVEEQKWEFYRNCQRFENGWVYTGYGPAPTPDEAVTKSWFYIENGIMRTGWVKYNNEWYMLEPYDTQGNGALDGGMVYGWIFDENYNSYYFLERCANSSCYNSSTPNKPDGGKMLKSTTKTIDGRSFTFDSGGKCTNCTNLGVWKRINNNHYYIYNKEKVKNETRVIDGVEYTFNNDGICTNCKNRWVKIGCNWLYLNEYGEYLRNIKKTINGVEYTFNASGFCTSPDSCNAC